MFLSKSLLFKSCSTRMYSINVSKMPKINFVSQPVVLSNYQALVQFYSEEEINDVSSFYGLSAAYRQDLLGKLGSVTNVYPHDGSSSSERVFLVGLGKICALKPVQVKLAASSGLKACEGKKLNNVIFQVPDVATRRVKFHGASQNTSSGTSCCNQESLSTLHMLELMVRGILDNSYSWQKHVTDEDRRPHVVDSISIQLENHDGSADLNQIHEIINNAQVVMSAKYFARNLGNERGDIATPDWYEEQVNQTVAYLRQMGRNVALRVLNDNELQQLGLNLIHSVGRGAKSLPRLVILESRNNPNSDQSVALVGKGITFDTGGYNLKSTGFIETMYLDNCGAATVLASFRAVVELGLPQNILAVLCLAENSIGKDSVLPSSIIKSYKGKTVEIDNTDAEGRLVLADGLSFVQRNYNVSHVVDLATLTGACVVALGGKIAGLFTNDEEFSSQIKNSALAKEEWVWCMPIMDHHSEEMKGSQSDLKNTGKSRYGGSCTAAAFLREFIEEGVKWCHLDIAGPAESSECKGFASGFGVELLVEYLKNKKSS